MRTMKNAMVGFAFLLGANLGQAQALPRYDDIKLEVKEDYTAAANQAALQAANFLLSTPWMVRV